MERLVANGNNLSYCYWYDKPAKNFSAKYGMLIHLYTDEPYIWKILFSFNAELLQIEIVSWC